ncbi:MAG: 3-oxoacid CoA-transferase, partial [Candidatus Eisenbacteria bacterium]|nr:3-oxoacid CoA-transferase [Candidatus Eisenbacteria bacterium]
ASDVYKRQLLERCTLPLTGQRCVHRVITEYAVVDVEPGRGFVLRELAPGFTAEEVQAMTGSKLHRDGEIGVIAVD